MKFFTQLKLLLWKNFTLRRRQTVRNIIEIGWPLVLFFILVLVRFRRDPEYPGNKFYRPRAMPSAGMVPFMQSFLCDFTSRGVRYPTSNLPDLQSSSLTRLFEDALPIMENSTIRERFLRFNSDYEKVIRDRERLNELLNTTSSLFTRNMSEMVLRRMIRDPEGFRDFLLNVTNLKPQVVNDLLNSKINVSMLSSLFNQGRLLAGSLPDISDISSLPLTPAGGSRLLQLLTGRLGGSPLSGLAQNPDSLQYLLWYLENRDLINRALQNEGTAQGELARKVLCEKGFPLDLNSIVKTPTGNLSTIKTPLCALDTATLQKIATELRSQIMWPNNTALNQLQNLTALSNETRRFLMETLQNDIVNVAQDISALQSFEAVIIDYISLADDMTGGGFNDVICGRRRMPGAGANRSGGLEIPQNGEWRKGATALLKRLSEGSEDEDVEGPQTDSCLTVIQKVYPKYKKILANETASRGKDKCNVINPYLRMDCGWPGISPLQCKQMGCCFDSSVSHTRFCFFDVEKAECGCVLNQVIRRASGTSGDPGQGHADAGFIQLAQLFLKGEILYTPDNNVTRRLVNEIKDELSDLKLVEQFAEWWVNNSDAIRATVMNVTRLMSNLNATGALPTILQNPELRKQAQQILDMLPPQANQENPTLANLTRLVNNTVLSGNSSAMNISSMLDQLDDAFRLIILTYRCIQHEYFVPFDDEVSLVGRAINTSQIPVIASLVFENIRDEDTTLPKHVMYKIRQDPDYTPRTDRIRSWYWRPGPSDGFRHTGYLNFGFMYLQDLIDRALISMMFNDTVFEPGVYLQQFPYPCYIHDRFVFYIGGTMPLFMTLAWIYTVAMIVKSIVYEKEKRLKEVMKVMGLGRGVHWCAWFINSAIMMLITIFLLVITLKKGRILQNSDPLIVSLFMVSFMLSTITMCFLISVFFSRANVAAACGGIIYFLTYLPYTIVRWFEALMSTSQKGTACLSSTVAFGVGCNYFARYEEQGIGIQWSNLYSSPIGGDGFSLGYAMAMMIIDSIIYLLLTLYIEAIKPGEFGIPRPWYFPFQKSYWFPEKPVVDEVPMNQNSRAKHGAAKYATSSEMDDVAFGAEDQTDTSVAMETEPMHLPLGVAIRELVKIYKDGNKLAVDGLSLNLYEGQILSFLGHNGAGKTTTMSVLTGLFPPTRGTALISGYDIRTDIDVIRKNLGMCPQHNVLFDKLTVEEHLWFYASLKGMERSRIPREITKFLDDIGLENKRHELAANLSGGMKRKLSVAMAFVAESKVVILDEPTAGVDPYARRGIWDLLLKYKQGRTVLLSTHHMDEADVLGDRIAIISQGKLQCCGTSLFLKGHYGNGYYLTLTKKIPGVERPGTAGTLRDVKLNLDDQAETNSSSTDEGVGLDSVDASEDSLGSGSSDPIPDVVLADSDVFCKEDSVTSFIKSHIPSANLVEHVGSELTYVLPTAAAKEGKFQDMFEDLDVNLQKLRVGSYGVSDTTLEEVFLKVAEESEAADKEAAEVPVRRPSFRHHIFRRSRVHQRLPSDRNELLDNMEEEDENVADPPEPKPRDAVDSSYDPDKRVSALALLFHQFLALLVKRFHHTRRNRKSFVAQVIFPAFFVCLAMAVAQIRPFYEMPPRDLNPEMFMEAKPHENYVLFSNDDPRDPLARNMTEVFLQYPGLGAWCLHNECRRKPIRFRPPRTPLTNSSPDCSCTSGMDVCPAGAGGPRPPQWTSYSGNIIQNMTGRNITDNLLKTYRKKYITKRYGGVTFGDNFDNLPDTVTNTTDPAMRRLITPRNAKVWYNNKGYHAMPSFLNVLTNTILRVKANEKGRDPSEYGITTYNHPMNYTREQLNDETFVKRAVDVLVAICVVFALSFVPASFVVFLVSERVSKAKHLHLVSGVKPYVYWMANFVWDMFNYFIPAMLCVFIFLMFGEESYTTAMNFPPTLCLLLLYGWSITPLMYPASYIFSVSSTAYIVLISINLFIGINCTLATFILELFQDDQELTDINNALKQVFLIFPNYCLGRGLIDLAKNQFLGIFSRFGQNLVRDPFEWDIVGRNIMAMIIQGFVFFALTVLMEYRFFIKSKPVKVVLKPIEDEEDDVERERQRIMSGAGECTDVLRLVNLTKVYKSRRKRNVAVNRLCVGVSKGECFGLLGVNGAGKTTAFKMLTGDIPVTSGEAFVDGHSILADINGAHQSMGYCPQFDALDELLTAKDHLRLYARLRGVPEDDVPKVVSSLIQRMDLVQYQDVCAGKYSGGNKRKLSTAIALIGNPAIVFLDEPTTGMDPKARRFLWNIITGIVKEGRTIILTSHSMEECEALCNRVAIMVNGEMKCLGSPQHLKNKYGDGYTVTLRVAGPDPDTEQVSQFITSVFPNAILKDKHHNMLEYQLPSRGLSVSRLFGHLEANRKVFNIEDYSVTQTTLDQVFINFAKNQTDGIENEPSQDTTPAPSQEMATFRFSQMVDGDHVVPPVEV